MVSFLWNITNFTFLLLDITEVSTVSVYHILKYSNFKVYILFYLPEPKWEDRHVNKLYSSKVIIIKICWKITEKVSSSS